MNSGLAILDAGNKKFNSCLSSRRSSSFKSRQWLFAQLLAGFEFSGGQASNSQPSH
jgi:hypothetical protein